MTRDERRFALDVAKGRLRCLEIVETFTPGGRDILRSCGTYAYNEQVLCDVCETRARQRYPQGWRTYPGDVCEHGTYVGGVGIDWLCGPCEMGYESGWDRLETATAEVRARLRKRAAADAFIAYSGLPEYLREWCYRSFGVA